MALEEDGNWDDGNTMEEMGFRQGTKAQIGVIVDMEDDVYLEFEEEEEVKAELAEQKTWKLLARYMANFKPNTKAMFTRFTDEVLHLRIGIRYSEKGKNYYMVTLFSKGDYDFVMRGGPWIFNQNALIVKNLDEAAQPSKSVLNSVPVWVRIYDVPWGKQNDVWGKRYGNGLGKALDVDVPASERDKKEFLRVRVNLPYDRRLQTQITTGVKGKPREVKVFKLKYERVPYYCSHCGFMGHKKDECEKRRMGVPSLDYDAHELRCSPYKKFAHRTFFAACRSGIRVPYTYDNKRSGRANVWVRLDRVVACSTWRDRFAKTSIKHLTSPVSDHFPVLVEMQQEVRLPRRVPRRQYEILWERESELGERIAVAWGEAGQKSDLADIMNSLSHVMTMLQGWSKRKFGNVLRELDKARKNLENLRAPVTWLKEGDRNTRFFHQNAVWRARKNKIKKLKDTDGTWRDAPTDMERMARSYFQELFTCDPSLSADELLSLIQEKVTTKMNDDLCKDVTDDEISDAIFQIGPLKAPSVDDFPAHFYQRNWGTIKEEIINVVNVFFVTGRMPDGHLEKIANSQKRAADSQEQMANSLDMILVVAEENNEISRDMLTAMTKAGETATSLSPGLGSTVTLRVVEASASWTGLHVESFLTLKNGIVMMRNPKFQKASQFLYKESGMAEEVVATLEEVLVQAKMCLFSRTTTIQTWIPIWFQPEATWKLKMDMRQDLQELVEKNGLPLFCIYYLAWSYLEVVVKIAITFSHR
ncbi:hypothetical protein ACQ4PT_013257 [Festuca glaucescens]